MDQISETVFIDNLAHHVPQGVGADDVGLQLLEELLHIFIFSHFLTVCSEGHVGSKVYYSLVNVVIFGLCIFDRVIGVAGFDALGF